MKVLIVDDERDLAGLVGAQLNEDFGFDIDYAGDVAQARLKLTAEAFDVVVVDMRFRSAADEFAERRRRQHVSIVADTGFLLSGLAVISDVGTLGHRTSDASRKPGTVVWSNFEDNRVLQIMFCYQQLGVRVFAFKGWSDSRPGGSIRALADAIKHADEGLAYADAKAQAYLPGRGSPRLGDALFAKPSWRSIWRALATGSSGRDELKVATMMAKSTVNNNLVDMNRALSAFDPGLPEREPLKQLIAYASNNWEFFLDDTVIRAYPPDEARGINKQ